MNAGGMKTPASTRAMPISAPLPSSIAASAASRGDLPCSIFASIASTTTIAIVVVEAIEAKIEQGRSPREAALAAMDEGSGALIGIALVLAGVFIPPAFIAGLAGALYRQFALTI